MASLELVGRDLARHRTLWDLCCDGLIFITLDYCRLYPAISDTPSRQEIEKLMNTAFDIRNMTRPEVDELVSWAARGCTSADSRILLMSVFLVSQHLNWVDARSSLLQFPGAWPVC